MFANSSIEQSGWLAFSRTWRTIAGGRGKRTLAANPDRIFSFPGAKPIARPGVSALSCARVISEFPILGEPLEKRKPPSPNRRKTPRLAAPGHGRSEFDSF